jgi:hypothetical protein
MSASGGSRKISVYLRSPYGNRAGRTGGEGREEDDEEKEQGRGRGEERHTREFKPTFPAYSRE